MSLCTAKRCWLQRSRKTTLKTSVFGSSFPSFFPDPQRFVTGEPLPLLLDDEGAFDASGIPPGAWTVGIVAEPGEPNGGRLHRTVGQVTLIEGQTTRLDLDLEFLLPGTLEATVTLNGAPYGSGTVTLRNAEEWRNLTTDAAGHFTELLRPGTYEVLLQKHRPNHASAMLRCPATVTIVRAETVRQTFAVVAGTLQVRVRDHAGQPAPGVSVKIFPTEQFLPPTDSTGSTTLDVVAQNARLCVQPTLSNEDRQRLLAEANAANRADPYEGLWLTLAEAIVQPGQTAEVELSLPAGWRQ